LPSGIGTGSATECRESTSFSHIANQCEMDLILRLPMAIRKKAPSKKPIEQYGHEGKKRTNNPPVGLVDAKSDGVEVKKTYAYDPHLDPTLVWAGKAERTSFEIPTVSLHVHERIDPRSIIEAVRKKNGSDYEQMSLFSSVAENPPLREAIEFYKHAHNWSNRLVAGDSLLVMNSLLEKEGLAGQVQMVYFDPPYGIKYGSNFQPFVNKRDVKDGKDEDLTAEPEMVKAFRDTWELGLHSYLSYLRDRLLLARELLHESGSVFVQISDENLHHIREILDEVFGERNFVSQVTFQKTGSIESKLLSSTVDYLVWYGRDITKTKYRPLYRGREIGDTSLDRYDMVMLKDGSTRRLTPVEIETGEIPEGARRYQLAPLYSEGATSSPQEFEFQGKKYVPRPDSHWKTTVEGLKRLATAKRIEVMGSVIRYRRFADDFPVIPIGDRWESMQIGTQRVYVVQTAPTVMERCLLMTTDPGDLVLDITCGSGTTAYVAEQWGRRWITCDTSRVALTLAKQRLMTAVFDYYRLAHDAEGVDSGFRYKTVPHVTLKSIANNDPLEQETLYDQPLVDNSKARVTGPFTVEAVPAPMVKSLAEISGEETAAPMPADDSVSRTGETVRQSDWRGELLRAGIRGKGGQMIRFSRVEPLSGTRWLHADAETKAADKSQLVPDEMFAPKRVVVSFGPEHAPLEQKQVEMAIEEARKLVPRPELIVFAAFQFDPEAAKDIDELNWPGTTTLKAQMNADLLTEDLKKKRTSNESFWLIGQPDVVLRQIKRGESLGKWEVEVHGFDYYDTKTGQIVSGSAQRIAVWMLDTDYDWRSLFPRQVFFPMTGEKEGWSKLARNLKAEIDESLIEVYRGTVSLPFELGKHSRVAVKIVDDRGIESLRIINVE
jgi:adenine-specific DNA-methyltransferase